MQSICENISRTFLENRRIAPVLTTTETLPVVDTVR
jgi:hypothetical protein